MRTGPVLAAAAWLSVAVLATAGGVAALSAVGAGITDPAVAPLNRHDVENALAASPAPPGSPSAAPPGVPSGSPPASPARTDPVPFATRGGTLLARCAGDAAELVSWTPAQGFAVNEVRAGPASSARVEFDGEHTEVKVEIRCRAGVPRMRQEIDGDDSGHDD